MLQPSKASPHVCISGEGQGAEFGLQSKLLEGVLAIRKSGWKSSLIPVAPKALSLSSGCSSSDTPVISGVRTLSRMSSTPVL